MSIVDQVDDNLVPCETCPSLVKLVDLKKLHGMMMCPDCHSKETALQEQNNTPEAQKARLDAHNAKLMAHRQELGIIEKSQMIDQSIQLRQEIFTAGTIACVELSKAVYDDPDIPLDKKEYRIAELVLERKNHFQKVIFDLSEEQVKKQNELRAVVTYLNEQTNKLRTEEREKLKLQDLNYKPSVFKPVTGDKKPKVSKAKKYDKQGIRDAAAKLAIWCVDNGKSIIQESAIQMLCVQKNCSPDEALETFKKALG